MIARFRLAGLVFGVVVLCGGSLFFWLRRAEPASLAKPVSTAAMAPSGTKHNDESAYRHEEDYRAPAVATAAKPAATAGKYFGSSGPVTLQEFPAGPFRTEVMGLSAASQDSVLATLARLKVPRADAGSLHTDRTGRLYYACRPPQNPNRPLSANGTNAARAAVPGAMPAAVPVASPPIRHSRSGASKVIYLDFNGHTITATAWNNSKGSPGDEDYRPAVTSYVAKPFDKDGDPTTFSDLEQVDIIDIWERVSEDYRPFDVDVTTEEPGTFGNTTGRVLITNKVDANGVDMPTNSAAGVAYLDVFGYSNYGFYSPALIYADNAYNYSDYIAEAVSHEMGHNLSLSHDGGPGEEYYDGHGSSTDPVSWGPIMGSCYDKDVTQWSKGEYYGATNTEDDLTILSEHLGYIPDDVGDSNGGAIPFGVSGNSLSGSGVISTTGEGDRFSFTASGTNVAFYAAPYKTSRNSAYADGGNLDIMLELRTSADVVVAATQASDGTTIASLSAAVSSGSVYYLRVTGTGAGSPALNPPSGYTNYGSLGHYSLAGTQSTVITTAPSFTQHPASIAVTVAALAQFTVAATGNPSPTYLWQRLAAGGGAWNNLINGASYSGVSTATLTVSGTTAAMNGDQFRCVATNTAGSAISNGALLTVVPVVSTVSSVSDGDFHTMFVKTDGTLWGTGANYSGQLGDGTTIERHLPVLIASNVVSVSAGSFFTLFLKTDGTLWGMGENDGGQLGDGTTTARSLPVQVASNVASVSAGAGHAHFIKADGTLWAMGNNYYGQLGDGTTTTRTTPVQVASNVASVSDGFAHTVFVKTDGTLWGMGINTIGELGDGTTTNRHVPVQVGSNVASASAGGAYTLYVKTNGSLWATGSNEGGKFGDGTTTSVSTAVQVAGGVRLAVAGRHSLFIKTDGTLWAMGNNDYGQLGDGTVTTRVSPVQVASQVVHASTGEYHSVFVLADQTLWAMGRVIGWSDGGIQGVITRPERVSPLMIGFPLIVVQPLSQTVRASGAVTLAVVASGTPAPTYQWRKDGFDLTGANSASLTLTKVRPADEGSYTVVVSNTKGSVTSNVATLTVRVAITDFNADGKTDILWQNASTGQRALWLMNGGDFAPLNVVSLGWVDTSWSMAGATDFNGDGFVDILWQNAVTGQRALWLMNGGDFTPTNVVNLGYVPTEWNIAAASDFNGDGHVDILWQNTATGQRALWLMNGGDFTPTNVVSLGWVDTNWSMAAATDFNGDGKIDILWQNTATGQRALWLMNGGDFTPTNIVSLGWVDTNWSMAGAMDFNGDGLTDILWQNIVTGQRALWLMNGGDFVPTNIVNLGYVPNEWMIVR